MLEPHCAVYKRLSISECVELRELLCGGGYHRDATNNYGPYFRDTPAIGTIQNSRLLARNIWQMADLLSH